MKLLLGIGVGVLGMWAYHGGKLRSLMGAAPEPVQQTFNRTAERINQVANPEQLRRAASSVQDRVQQAKPPEIAIPTAAEVAGRPSEPLPRYEPEGVQTENA